MPGSLPGMPYRMHHIYELRVYNVTLNHGGVDHATLMGVRSNVAPGQRVVGRCLHLRMSTTRSWNGRLCQEVDVHMVGSLERSIYRAKPNPKP